MFILRRIAKKLNPAKDANRFNKEVEIPVGGITPGGVIYEKKVYPDGKDLLYKEVHIDNTQQSATVAKEKEREETQKADTFNK